MCAICSLRSIYVHVFLLCHFKIFFFLFWPPSGTNWTFSFSQFFTSYDYHFLASQSFCLYIYSRVSSFPNLCLNVWRSFHNFTGISFIKNFPILFFFLFFFLFHASIILESCFKDFLRGPWNYKHFPVFSPVFETRWLTLLCKFSVSVLPLRLWRLHFFRDRGTR